MIEIILKNTGHGFNIKIIKIKVKMQLHILFNKKILNYAILVIYCFQIINIFNSQIERRSFHRADRVDVICDSLLHFVSIVHNSRAWHSYGIIYLLSSDHKKQVIQDVFFVEILLVIFFNIVVNEGLFKEVSIIVFSFLFGQFSVC